MFQTSDIDESMEMQNPLPHFHTIPSSSRIGLCHELLKWL
ncbi:hypothetical protein T03_12935 [Trichinella britovi]|uniref:Uncharacterized protein n=1 Tax=Trichinella britovi TaxID=45882 RepID=A0A0V0Z464_TRIBR|nr:hypothetical protein T03_12794 [Trichinella britovi]KRY53639.1 hypothetical protein T03_12935 [Trichinella britovi]